MNIMWICGYAYREIEKRVDEFLEKNKDSIIFTGSCVLPSSMFSKYHTSSGILSNGCSRKINKWVINELKKKYSNYEITCDPNHKIINKNDTVEIKLWFKRKANAKYMTLEEIESELGHKVILYRK